MNGYISIAIDGPSGVGKSSAAGRLAEKLGYTYIDTGALFRTLTLYCLDKGISPYNAGDVSRMVQEAAVSVEYLDGIQHMYLCGTDVTGRIRSEEVSRAASVISQYPDVRSRVLDMERSMAACGNVIMDGRDIGTVVLPDAELKIFLTASPEERAKRRYNELKEKKLLNGAGFGEILSDIMLRDERDTVRENAPLKAADDAVIIDTSSLTLEEVTDRIIGELRWK